MPPKVGDSILAITICVTRACAAGAPQRTTPVNETQQAMTVAANGVLVMRTLPRGPVLTLVRIIPAAAVGGKHRECPRNRIGDARRSVFPAGCDQRKQVCAGETAAVIPGLGRKAESPESITTVLGVWIPRSPPLRCGAPE